MEMEFAERGWSVLEDLEVEQEVVHWVELVGVDWGANQRKAAPPPQLVDPPVQPNLDISQPRDFYGTGHQLPRDLA